MIKVGISGAETPVAGELLRLCQHHPDVEIVTAYAPEKAGLPVSSVHHGFIGEERILFTSNLDATALDAVFLIQGLYSDSDWVNLLADRPQLKLIIFPQALSEGMIDAFAPVYGLSEINRKPLVRGARVAVVPNPLASPLLIALYPLARHLMLSGDIRVDIETSADLLSDSSLRQAVAETSDMLQRIQTSFQGRIEFRPILSASDRTLRMKFSLPVSASLEEVMKLYDSIYDDHNFTYVVHHPVSQAEVEGTHKVIVSVSKSSAERLNIEIVADARMRGGAGEALHIMNLLFSLHEKTGLDLKSSAWSKNGDTIDKDYVGK